MRLEKVKLTASFKVNKSTSLELLFSIYREVLCILLDYAHSKAITSFKRLKSEKYHEMRARYPDLPSHYIHTACQMACSIYKSFRKLKRRGRAKSDKSSFRGSAIMLDDHLFSINLNSWEASIATENGRVKLKLCHGTYYEKFKEMKVGQAWLVKRGEDCYLKVVFSKTVELLEQNDKAIAVDVNENNVTFGSRENVIKLETKERTIRTAYFLKQRRLQSKPRLNEKKILAKYRGRERRRVEAIYHKVANGIVNEAKRKRASTIILENLKNIRRKKRSRELNGRLNRWSFRKLQTIVGYKAKLAGINVVYVKAKGTSSLCPICGVKLSPNGHRSMRCRKCGLEQDRDIIAVRNLLRKYLMQINVPSSSVQGECPPMT